MTDLTDRAHEITVRRAREAAERLARTALCRSETFTARNDTPMPRTGDRPAEAKFEETQP